MAWHDDGWRARNAATWALGLMTGCGPAVADDGTAQGFQSSTVTDTEADSQSDTSGEATTASTDPPVSTGPMPDPTATDTGSDLPACPRPEVGDVTLEVHGLEPSFGGLLEAQCTVANIEEGDSFDAFALDCIPDEGAAVTVDVAYSNAAVLLPSAVQPGQVVGLSYVASAQPVGQWLTLRDSDGELLLGIANGGGASPFVDGQAHPDFYDPLAVELVGGVCPQGPGNCFAVGEPAALRFDDGAETLDALPYQVEKLGAFTIHTGYSWLPDPDSEYGCDGDSDDWAAFIIGVP